VFGRGCGGIGTGKECGGVCIGERMGTKGWIGGRGEMSAAKYVRCGDQMIG
jgi:hypothetical protein